MSVVRDPLHMDQLIDSMLTRRIDGLPDPLDHGEFPSLGFEHEKRGAYFIQVTNADSSIIVSVWRMVGPSRGPDKYRLSTYRQTIYNGAVSYAGDVAKAVELDSLLAVQAFIHSVFTS